MLSHEGGRGEGGGGGGGLLCSVGVLQYIVFNFTLSSSS